MYYGGNEEDWKNIDISSSNTSLENATVHYDTPSSPGLGDETQDKSIYDGILSIRILTEWNEENETASFSSGIAVHINENTDLSFLNMIDELIGQKVLVVEDKNEVGLLKGIYPVNEIVGKVSEWGTSSIIINGEQYPTAKDWSMNEILVDPDATVLCYANEGTIVSVVIPQEESGVLQEWNVQTNEITIDNNVYVVKINDPTFLNSIEAWMGHTVDYVLLDDTIIDISFPDYSESYTAKVKEFDSETGELFFDDGQSYFISNDLEESPSNFIGKWCVYTISTSQSEGIQITDIEPVKTELDVTLTLSKKDIYYKDGEFGFLSLKMKQSMILPWKI